MRTNPSHKAQSIGDAAQEDTKGPFCLVLSSGPHSETSLPIPPNRTQKTFPFRASLSNTLSSPRTAEGKASARRLSFSGCSSLLIPTDFTQTGKAPKDANSGFQGAHKPKIRNRKVAGLGVQWVCLPVNTLSWHHSSYFLGARWNRGKATVTVRRVTTPPLLAAMTESH